MKSPLVPLAVVVLLSACIAACGSTGKQTPAALHTASSSVAAAPAQTGTDADNDNDLSAPYDDRSNNSVLASGHQPSASERRAITLLLKRYYKAATAENGARACAMIYSTLAEAVPEDYGQSPPGQPYMKGTTCPMVLTMIFKHFHPQLSLELPKLKVAGMRISEGHGVAVLRFGRLPERQIAIRREGHTWKISALLDSELP